jgi:hypothetical protein
MLLAKVHSKLGHADKAMINKRWAENINPRGANSLLFKDTEQMDEDGPSLPDEIVGNPEE